MNRTRVKICGITSIEDALAAVDLGADSLGLVFYPASKRAITAAAAAAIRSKLPAFVALTGLFVDAAAADINSVLATVRLDYLQFHGNESPDFCASFGVPYIKAIRVQDGMNVVTLAAAYPGAAGILLDSYDKHQAGGTGTRFDWAVASHCVEQCGSPIILAGGLNAENVAAAIAQVRPYAVDVSSGVESEPGNKSPARMQAFFKEVYRGQF